MSQSILNHQFNVSHAEKYGVVEAIFINHFMFWIQKNEANQRNYHDGRYWTYNTPAAFEKKYFCYLTPKQIRRALESLVEQGVLVKGHYSANRYDRTCWYAFAEPLENWLFPFRANAADICPNTKIDVPKWANGTCPNGQITEQVFNQIQKPTTSTASEAGEDFVASPLGASPPDPHGGLRPLDPHPVTPPAAATVNGERRLNPVEATPPAAAARPVNGKRKSDPVNGERSDKRRSDSADSADPATKMATEFCEWWVKMRSAYFDDCFPYTQQELVRVKELVFREKSLRLLQGVAIISWYYNMCKESMEEDEEINPKEYFHCIKFSASLKLFTKFFPQMMDNLKLQKTDGNYLERVEEMHTSFLEDLKALSKERLQRVRAAEKR